MTSHLSFLRSHWDASFPRLPKALDRLQETVKSAERVRGCLGDRQSAQNRSREDGRLGIGAETRELWCLPLESRLKKTMKANNGKTEETIVLAPGKIKRKPIQGGCHHHTHTSLLCSEPCTCSHNKQSLFTDFPPLKFSLSQTRRL